MKKFVSKSRVSTGRVRVRMPNHFFHTFVVCDFLHPFTDVFL